MDMLKTKNNDDDDKNKNNQASEICNKTENITIFNFS